MNPTEALFPFEIGACYGDRAEPLVDHIILAEFDIDTGSTVRHQYPQPVEGYANDYFAEYMLPEGAHNREQDWTVLFLNRTKPRVDEGSWTGDASELNPPSGPEGRFLYGLNVVRTKHDKNVRRGAVVKAMAIFSRYHFLDIFRAPLIMSLDKYYDNPSVSVLEDLYNALNSVPLASLPRPTWYERALMTRGVTLDPVGAIADAHQPSHWQWTEKLQLGEAKMRLQVPLHRSPDDFAEGAIATLLRTFGETAMRIYHAAVTGQRIMFVGYNHAAGDVSNFVLATVALISPPVVGVLRRAFPYATLSDLDFLQVPGYIAGVTNPMFEQHEEWWDLLCVLDLPNNTGTVMTSDEKKAEKDKAAGRQVERKVEERLFEPLDAKFIVRVLAGLEMKLGDAWIKKMFFTYTQALLDAAMDNSQFTNSPKLTDLHKRLLTLNATRIQQVTRLPEYETLQPNPWHGIPMREGSTVDGLTLRTHLRKLLIEETSNHQEVQTMFNDIATTLVSERQLQVLIALFPDIKHGIAPIASGLLHPSATVRKNAVVLLRNLQSYPSTRPVVDSLNHFLALAFNHVSQEIDSGAFDSAGRRRSINLMAGSSPNTSRPASEMEDPLQLNVAVDDAPMARPHADSVMSDGSHSSPRHSEDEDGPTTPASVRYTRAPSSPSSTTSPVRVDSDDTTSITPTSNAELSPNVAARKRVISMRIGSRANVLWAAAPPLPPPPPTSGK